MKDGSKFTDCAVFDNAGVTCILYRFEGVELELGKLAIWRLQTYDEFFGVWLSDYVENSLGGFISKETQSRQKPDCPLIGRDGNIYNLMGIASSDFETKRYERTSQRNVLTDYFFQELLRGFEHSRRVCEYHVRSRRGRSA